MTDMPPLDAKAVAAAWLLTAILAAGLVADFVLLGKRRSLRERLGPAADAFARVPWRWTDALIVVLVLLWSQMAIASSVASAEALGWLNEAASEPLHMLLQAVCPALLGIAAIALLVRRRMAWSDALNPEGRSLPRLAGPALLAYLAAMPAVFVIGSLYATLLQWAGFDVGQQPILTMLVDPDRPVWLRATLVVVAIGVAPFIEEFVFRGMLLPLALRRWSPHGALVVTSAAFALLHVHLASAVPLFILAYALGLAAIHTRSLVTPILMHAMFNGVGVAAQWLLQDARELLLPG